MDKITEWFQTNSSLSHVLGTLLLLSLVFFLRRLFIGKIRKSDWRIEDKRKWYVSIRNWSTLILFFGFVIIWATEIQTFALSVVAVTAALIISGKEILLCAHGGLLRSFNSYFKVGDRIEIDNLRGDVIDTNLMVTRILEIGPQNFTHQFTGRAITIPNSLFLTKPLVNESFLHKYVLHVFKITLSRKENWRLAENCMMEAATEECEEFMEEAKNSMERLSKREGIDVPKVAPRITYKLQNVNDMEMIVRIPAPSSLKGTVEQKILKRFMEKYFPESPVS